MNGRLEVVYCDFFKLDPRSRGILTPPVMTSDMLFQYLGIEAQPWSKGDFCHSVKQVPYNLSAFSSSTPDLLRFVYMFILHSLWVVALKLNMAFPSPRYNQQFCGSQVPDQGKMLRPSFDRNNLKVV